MIQPHPLALPGSVSQLPFYSPTHFPPTCAILCRNTAPLITFAYSLITRKLPCRVLGREIGQGLISLIDKLNAKSIDELESKLEGYRNREIARAYSKNDESAVASIEDRCTCLSVFIRNLRENERTISLLKTSISDLFSDDKTGPSRITLSTIHKSKGLEYPDVFILDRELLPSKYARSAWQLAQEQNLIYVAVTRAKVNLYYITSGQWKRDTEMKPRAIPDYMKD